MSETHDIVVAGAGHNSLLAAAYLAKAGFRCLVLEAQDHIGGDTATEEMSLPGFRHDSCSTAHNLIQSSPTLRAYAPNLTDDKILSSVVKSPPDLERSNGHNWHGSCHGGDMSPEQMGDRRPVPGWAQHRMPIPGLYQTGATTHPGGSVSGAPGRNAAAVMLADLGTSIEEVVGG